MARMRLKTLEYAFPAKHHLSAPTSASGQLAELVPIRLELPEAAITFRNVMAYFSGDDVVTATGGTVTARRINMQLGTAAATGTVSTQTYTHSGENVSHFYAHDFTNYFRTNWAGPAMGCTASFAVSQSTGTTLGISNGAITLTITYEYDAEPTASVRQARTAYIPLEMPTGYLSNLRPTSASAIIPALETYCLESSKSFNNTHIVIQGNTGGAAFTTPVTMSVQLDTFPIESGALAAALATDRFHRQIIVPPNLNMTQSVGGPPQTASFYTGSLGMYVWNSTGSRHPHHQAWLVSTYTYDVAGTSQSLNTVILPMELDSPMGGPAAPDYQRGSRELFIQEPGDIQLQRLAYYCFFDQAAAIAGLNARVGTGSFASYAIDSAATVAGSNALMARNDTSHSLARGRNTLNFDIYRTDTTDFGWNVSGFWIVNYTSLVASGTGVANHNKTIFINQRAIGPNWVAVANIMIPSQSSGILSSSIPSDNYYITALGNRYYYTTEGTATSTGISIGVERLPEEGGVQWESAYRDLCQTDPETGLHQCWAQTKELGWRWEGDFQESRMPILDRTRRYTVYQGGSAAVQHHLDTIFTYHNIVSAVSGTISGSSGGLITLGLHRANTGELVATSSRTGDGDYSIRWFDNTEPVYVDAYEGTTLVGRSLSATASIFT